jgi:hypothetical protein
MFSYPLISELSPLWLAQAALTIWMLVDANRRGVDYYWFWIILIFQPLGPWTYFLLYKARELRVGHGRLAGLFQRPASLAELRHRVERLPTVAGRLELSERLVETGECAEAVPHLEAVLAHEPGHCQALFLMAACRRALGHPDQAVPLLEKVVARHPSWREYEAWQTLVQVRTEALEHRCLLAEHLLAAGEKNEARQVVEQGLDEYRYLSGHSRRRDRRWVGKAKQLLSQSG